MPLPQLFDTARLRLARIGVNADSPFRSALHEVTATAAQTLNVGRVSVWRYLDDGRSMRCHFLHQPGRPDVTEGALLHRADFPHYFRALDLRRVVMVNDVAGDELSVEFRDDYFTPLDIHSMIDAPVYEGSSITGIVCHEHLSGPRIWTADEAAFAAAVADTVARLYDESKLLNARDALGAYRRQVEELRGAVALGRLATGMAQEFGLVLLAVDTHAKLLAGQGVAADPQLSRAAEGVLAATARGHRVVESLLRLGHPTHAKARVVDLSALLRHAEPLLRMAAGERVTLTVEPGAGLPRVLIDPATLERALIDLAGHARDTMPGGGRLHYRAYVSSPDASADAVEEVTIAIEDDGEGLDPRAAADLFEPFGYAHGAGAGVGLSTVRQALVRAGGHVEVDSAPGRGTTIRLCLTGIGPPPA